jgi:hypothetical protein
MSQSFPCKGPNCNGTLQVVYEPQVVYGVHGKKVPTLQAPHKETVFLTCPKGDTNPYEVEVE